MFNNYPNTNFHDLNLDWIIQEVKKIRNDINEFEATNKITWRGEWDINTSYPAWSIVDHNDNAYVSIVPVPNGVDITNSAYWVAVANYTALIGDIHEDISRLNNNSYFNGKKVVSYGDSTIVEGNSYIDVLPSFCNCEVTNRGVSGSTMSSGINLINAATDLSSYDVITLSYGTNEWQGSQNEASIRINIKNLINAIKNKNSTIDIIFCLAPYSLHNWASKNINEVGYSLEDVNNIIASELALYSIPCVNFFKESTCNEFNVTHKMNESGSTGIFVHPTDEFAKELCRILINTSNKYFAPDTRIPILMNYDFIEAQRQITGSELANNLYGADLCVKFDNSIYSTQKAFRSIGETFIIKGHATNSAVMRIGTLEIDIPIGYFEIPFTPINLGYLPIELNANNGVTIISDLMIYAINYKSIISNYCLNSGRGHVISNGSKITSNNVIYAFDEFGVHISSGSFVVNETINPNEVIATLGNYFPKLDTYILAINSNTLELIPLGISNNGIKSYKTLNAGSYSIIGATFNPNRNDYRYF